MSEEKFWISQFAVVLSAVIVLTAVVTPSCHKFSMRQLDVYEKCIVMHPPLECAVAEKATR